MARWAMGFDSSTLGLPWRSLACTTLSAVAAWLLSATWALAQTSIFGLNKDHDMQAARRAKMRR